MLAVQLRDRHLVRVGNHAGRLNVLQRENVRARIVKPHRAVPTDLQRWLSVDDDIAMFVDPHLAAGRRWQLVNCRFRCRQFVVIRPDRSHLDRIVAHRQRVRIEPHVIHRFQPWLGSGQFAALRIEQAATQFNDFRSHRFRQLHSHHNRLLSLGRIDRMAIHRLQHTERHGAAFGGESVIDTTRQASDDKEVCRPADAGHSALPQNVPWRNRATAFLINLTQE
ncbi:MAG: hypothetical protein ABIP48_18560 [Planctomycetota bacterium]